MPNYPPAPIQKGLESRISRFMESEGQLSITLDMKNFLLTQETEISGYFKNKIVNVERF